MNRALDVAYYAITGAAAAMAVFVLLFADLS